MLDLDRLRVLHALFLTGSVGGAARTLHVTGPAVSQQLARLERDIGQRVVERHGRGVRLTDVGLLLAGQAGELLAHVERVETAVSEFQGTIAGTLTVAAFATAVRGLLLDVVHRLGSRHPALRFSLREQEPHESVPALSRGQAELVIAQDWAVDELLLPDNLSRCALLDDTYDLAVPAGHPLAARERVALTELPDEDWIGWSSTQICHDWLLHTLRAGGIRPRIAHTASEHSTQLALVGAGFGVAVLPRLGREPAPASVHFVPLTDVPARRVFALWRTSTTTRPAIDAMLRGLRQFAAGEPASRR